MSDDAATRLDPGSILTGPRLRESLLFAAGFWLLTYATLSIWAILVTDGAATPLSLRRLITTGSGSLFYWLTIRLQLALRQRRTAYRGTIVLGLAGVACLLLFGIRITVYQLTGGTIGAEFGNNVQWLLLWAGYFLAGIGIFAATGLSRALEESRAAASAPEPADEAKAAEPDFWIERAGARQRVPLGDVLWFAAEGNYVQLHARGDGAPIGLLRGTLGAIEAQLDGGEFVRLHRSILCRVGAIRALRRLPSGAHVAQLDGGAEVPVGRSYRATVERMLGLAQERA